MKKTKKTILIFLGASALALGAAPLRADDVTDSIDEAAKAYKDGDYATATAALDTASQMIRQKRAESLVDYMPPVPSGWTAEDASTSAAGAAMFGGGISVERRYTRDDSSVTVKFVADSPMLQMMSTIINNPLLMSSSDNGKLERIKGQKALVKYTASEKQGEINVPIGGTMLVTVEGHGVTAAELKSFAEGINYGKLAGSQ